jgi:hypothetical protein
VIAANSNGGGYANNFQTQEPNFNNGGILASVLAELWDFDTRISSDGQGNPAPQDYLQALTGTPQHFRGYNQSTNHSAQADFKVTLDDPRWQNYYTDLQNNVIQPEIPPLPPGPYNDTQSTDTRHGLNYTHHLIRDFMFLDAAVNNNIILLNPEPAWPTAGFPYQVVPISLNTSEGNVAKYTQGTVHHSNPYYALNYRNDPPPIKDDGSLLNFESRVIGFTALLYELQNGSGTAANVVPNWFGVAVPDGITDFRNVIVYFHPNPTQSGAGYNPNDYQNKSGNNGTNWKELFAYVERLGKQLAGAAKYSSGGNDLRNQIVILPFMRDYDDVGVFPQYWSFIIKAILDDLYQQYQNGAFTGS